VRPRKGQRYALQQLDLGPRENAPASHHRHRSSSSAFSRGPKSSRWPEAPLRGRTRLVSDDRDRHSVFFRVIPCPMIDFAVFGP